MRTTWKKKAFWAFGILGTLFAVGFLAWGPLVSKIIEKPPYTVLISEAGFEVREYPALIVAEAEVKGPRKEAIQQGFRLIADYIFGKNTPQQKIAMTAPVIQRKHHDAWIIQFFMPSAYTLKTLPSPLSKEVSLRTLPAKKYVAIAFSGNATDALLQKNTDLLLGFVAQQKLSVASEPIYAFFNPPGLCLS